jgi:quinol monooxygenase YgiN
MKLTIEMKARPEKTRELYQTLQALLPAIRNEKGCRDCRVCRDVEDEETFLLTLDWDARTGLEAFLASDSGGALLGAVDMLSGQSRVRVGDNEPWGEVRSLKRMRKKKQK